MKNPRRKIRICRIMEVAIFVICFVIVLVTLAGFISLWWILVAGIVMFSAGEIGKVVMKSLKADLENAMVCDFADDLRGFIDQAFQEWPKDFLVKATIFIGRAEDFLQRGKYRFLYRDTLAAIDQIHSLLVNALGANTLSNDEKAREYLRQAREKCVVFSPETQKVRESANAKDAAHASP